MPALGSAVSKNIQRHVRAVVNVLPRNENTLVGMKTN
jgi:hypothetical protein